jgi:hypothetical protein
VPTQEQIAYGEQRPTISQQCQCLRNDTIEDSFADGDGFIWGGGHGSISLEQ